jgi:hypothetical protein
MLQQLLDADTTAVLLGTRSTLGPSLTPGASGASGSYGSHASPSPSASAKRGVNESMAHSRSVLLSTTLGAPMDITAV